MTMATVSSIANTAPRTIAAIVPGLSEDEFEPEIKIMYDRDLCEIYTSRVIYVTYQTAQN